MAYIRIKKEFANLIKNPIDGCTLSLADDFDLFHWQGTIFGPENSIYEGGIFQLEIIIKEEYPMVPPRYTFKTKIYHPNIDFNGRISLDILKDKWSPALTISTALKSIMILLTAPNFDDPLVPSVSQIFHKNPTEFEAIAREWTQKYAL